MKKAETGPSPMMKEVQREEAKKALRSADRSAGLSSSPLSHIKERALT
jgi:hypothetical protein